MCKLGCANCMFLKKDFLCNDVHMLGLNAFEVVSLVEKWSKEHPQKTRAQDFFEKFPNAARAYKNIPRACAGHCGYCG